MNAQIDLVSPSPSNIGTVDVLASGGDPRSPDPTYYLSNFKTALHWLAQRYHDLLSDDEGTFIEQFEALPLPSQALLVRLIMRKGEVFRSSKLNYPEIGGIKKAMSPLVALNWVDPNPVLDIDALFRLLNLVELRAIFPHQRAATLKDDFLVAVREIHSEPRTLQAWRTHEDEIAYRVTVAGLCTRYRLLFFGNFYQDWSEFVLADLGIFKYEQVELSRESRALQTRAEVEQLYRLYECRQRLHDEAPLTEVVALMPSEQLDNEWLEARRAKLLFQVARQYERQREFASALALYRQSEHPGSRLRSIRVMEQAGLKDKAMLLAAEAQRNPESDSEEQKIERVMRRLSRTAGRTSGSSGPGSRRPLVNRIDLCLELPSEHLSVERLVANHICRANAPVFYVENTLLNSLFGLLCWDAIFAPIPGAFFHRFHSGPADLLSPHFVHRRESLFRACTDHLSQGTYGDVIRLTYQHKQGTQSPFVFWGALTEELLECALRCIPVVHLQRCIDRLLANLRENCTGLPDLIQFWPEECRYRLVEVKAPGDRLQDNQRRWLDFCAATDIPVAVCYVRYTQGAP